MQYNNHCCVQYAGTAPPPRTEHTKQIFKRKWTRESVSRQRAEATSRAVHFGVGVTRSVASVAASRAGSTVSVSVWVSCMLSLPC
jgi:hypothetical protein